MTKNRTPTPVYLDPGMHPGLEVKGLIVWEDAKGDAVARRLHASVLPVNV